MTATGEILDISPSYIHGRKILGLIGAPCMATHLSMEQIRRFEGRRLSRAELDVVSDHIWACELCYQAYLTVLERRFPIVIDLDDLAGLKGWHLEGEELTAYLSRQMDDLDSDYARIHLLECAECRHRVSEARQYRTDNYFSKNGNRSKQQAAWNSRLPSAPSISAASFRIPAIAAVILAALALSLVILRPKPTRQAPINGLSTEVPTPDVPPQVSLPGLSPLSGQADHTVGGNTGELSERPEQNRVAGSSKSSRIQPKQQLNDSALVATALAMPPAIEMFDRSMAELIRGNGKSTQSFSIVGPFNTIVMDERPTLYWTPLKGATTYTVSVFDRNLRLVSASGPLTETQWVVQRLRQDTTYTWIVTALKDGTEVVAPPLPARAEFRIVQKAALTELNRRINATVSHAQRAVLYARAGLLDEAEREFEAHLRDQPADEQARKLLQTVKSWRRGENYRPPSPTTTKPAQ
jgi:hypothetical protein